MIPCRRRAISIVLVAAAGVLTALAPGVARASGTLDLTGSGSLDGDRYYATVTIEANATLKVNPFDGTKGGVLHLYANKIVIEAGATIDARGAGHAGADMANGTGPGGGKAGPDGFPGGGGAFGGDGGEGDDSTCLMMTTQLGGTHYASPPAIDFGSAGGAAGVTSAGTAGGNGGGAIILEAAEIDLSGALLADGADGNGTVGMIGSGGGAGGMILLRTNKLVVGTAAKISARGGNGGSASQNGGGGGGGVVVLDAAMTGTLTPDVSGGAAGDCTAALAGDGLLPTAAPPATCLDLDGDGDPAALCGGNDCDDSDKTIHPGAAEVCDGIDNDCDGIVDDNLAADACPAGFACQSGGCAPSMATATSTSSGGDTAKPDHLALEGGCTIGSAPSKGALGLAIAAALTLAVRDSRRRRARPHGVAR